MGQGGVRKMSPITKDSVAQKPQRGLPLNTVGKELSILKEAST